MGIFFILDSGPKNIKPGPENLAILYLESHL